jgi:hypothetical protein
VATVEGAPWRRVGSVGSVGAAFLGWLGLLKALDQVLASPWEATGAKR